MRSRFETLFHKINESRENEELLSENIGFKELFPSVKKASAKEKQTVVLMVNEMCASMCDIFSADLKDNGIAKVIGTKTMGAGGNVTPHMASPLLGNILTTTESLIVRYDGSLLENKGVNPDLEYKKTINDLDNKNEDFINAALKYALK